MEGHGMRFVNYFNDLANDFSEIASKHEEWMEGADEEKIENAFQKALDECDNRQHAKDQVVNSIDEVQLELSRFNRRVESLLGHKPDKLVDLREELQEATDYAFDNLNASFEERFEELQEEYGEQNEFWYLPDDGYCPLSFNCHPDTPINFIREVADLFVEEMGIDRADLRMKPMDLSDSVVIRWNIYIR